MTLHRSAKGSLDGGAVRGEQGLGHGKHGARSGHQRTAVVQQLPGETPGVGGIGPEVIRPAPRPPGDRGPERSEGRVRPSQPDLLPTEQPPTGAGDHRADVLAYQVEVARAGDDDFRVPERRARPFQEEKVGPRPRVRPRTVQKKLERLSGRSGRHPVQPSPDGEIVGNHALGKAPTQRGLRGDRHPRQVLRRADRPRLEAGIGEQLAVVRNVCRGVPEQILQPLDEARLQLGRGRPLTGSEPVHLGPEAASRHELARWKREARDQPAIHGRRSPLATR